MITTIITVPSTELRRLLIRITYSQAKTSVRFRLMGQMWQTYFMPVLIVTEKGVVLHSEIDNQSVVIKDLNEVMAFEFEEQLYHYEPNFHYHVEPTYN